MNFLCQYWVLLNFRIKLTRYESFLIGQVRENNLWDKVSDLLISVCELYRICARQNMMSSLHGSWLHSRALCLGPCHSIQAKPWLTDIRLWVIQDMWTSECDGRWELASQSGPVSGSLSWLTDIRLWVIQDMCTSECDGRWELASQSGHVSLSLSWLTNILLWVIQDMCTSECDGRWEIASQSGPVSGSLSWLTDILLWVIQDMCTSECDGRWELASQSGPVLGSLPSRSAFLQSSLYTVIRSGDKVKVLRSRSSG